MRQGHDPQYKGRLSDPTLDAELLRSVAAEEYMVVIGLWGESIGDVPLRLPLDTILAPEKFREYLLKKLPENDKSAFLSVAGYTLEDWQRLAEDIRSQILPLDATLGRETVFGTMYEIRGVLVGPNGRRLAVVTVWMIEAQSRNTKFITLFPDKESQYGI